MKKLSKNKIIRILIIVVFLISGLLLFVLLKPSMHGFGPIPGGVAKEIEKYYSQNPNRIFRITQGTLGSFQEVSRSIDDLHRLHKGDFPIKDKFEIFLVNGRSTWEHAYRATENLKNNHISEYDDLILEHGDFETIKRKVYHGRNIIFIKIIYDKK